jgi:hypothetical protein
MAKECHLLDRCNINLQGIYCGVQLTAHFQQFNALERFAVVGVFGKLSRISANSSAADITFWPKNLPNVCKYICHYFFAPNNVGFSGPSTFSAPLRYLISTGILPLLDATASATRWLPSMINGTPSSRTWIKIVSGL